MGSLTIVERTYLSAFALSLGYTTGSGISLSYRQYSHQQPCWMLVWSFSERRRSTPREEPHGFASSGMWHHIDVVLSRLESLRVDFVYICPYPPRGFARRGPMTCLTRTWCERASLLG